MRASALHTEAAEDEREEEGLATGGSAVAVRGPVENARSRPSLDGALVRGDLAHQSFLLAFHQPALVRGNGDEEDSVLGYGRSSSTSSTARCSATFSAASPKNVRACANLPST